MHKIITILISSAFSLGLLLGYMLGSTHVKLKRWENYSTTHCVVIEKQRAAWYMICDGRRAVVNPYPGKRV